MQIRFHFRSSRMTAVDTSIDTYIVMNCFALAIPWIRSRPLLPCAADLKLM